LKLFPHIEEGITDYICHLPVTTLRKNPFFGILMSLEEEFAHGTNHAILLAWITCERQ
jgi:hypothetical protein